MILCAAIEIAFQRDGRTVSAVVPGHRHNDCLELMATLGVPRDRQEVEGFITHRGDFLDRYNAYNHALRCGQLSDTTREHKASKGEQQLYSEDIY